ncbi:MAG: hypothetical protein LUF33_05890 [Clostridiales bacterium]|nr:hypothetical protein [Clostridiales bacterium]
MTLFENSDEITALYNGCAVSMAVSDGTFFITISVSGDDAQKCANVANQIVEKSIEVFDSYFVYGQIGEIREAQTPENPYSPNNVKNAMIGFAVGLALSCLISILVELIDTTIKSDDDIQEMYDLPVFAEIPDFEG